MRETHNDREKPQVRTVAIEGQSKLALHFASRKTGTGVPCPYIVRTRLGRGALGVQGQYLLGDLFYVGDAE